MPGLRRTGTRPNVFIVQLALLDPDPAILVVTIRHSVPPGQEGTDPALQPEKAAEFPFLDLTEGAYRLKVGAGLQTFELSLDDVSGDPSPGGKGDCLLWPLTAALPWLSGSPLA